MRGLEQTNTLGCRGSSQPTGALEHAVSCPFQGLFQALHGPEHGVTVQVAHAAREEGEIVPHGFHMEAHNESYHTPRRHSWVSTPAFPGDKKAENRMSYVRLKLGTDSGTKVGRDLASTFESKVVGTGWFYDESDLND